jgi:hypothetical protein
MTIDLSASRTAAFLHSPNLRRNARQFRAAEDYGCRDAV